MLLLALNMTTILPIALFGAFAAAAWWVMDMLASRNSRADERLSEIRSPGKVAAKRSSGVASMLERAAPALAKPLQPKTAAEESKLKQRLSYAGFRRDSAPMTFRAIKISMLIAGLFVGGGIVLLASGFTMKAGIRSTAIALLMFFIPDIVLWYLSRKRKQAIFLSLPDTLDLMVVCVEAGLGLDQAMRRVADEMAKTYRVICDEIKVCNFQLQMGRNRNDVLHDLGHRTGVDDLRALASILIQADKFGSSVGQALRVQSDSMRTRRRQIAEEKAAKTAVQLIFPLVLFIFPGIFVVLVGPAAITMIRNMFPAMQGAG